MKKESTYPIKFILLAVVLIAVAALTAPYIIKSIRPDTDKVYSYTDQSTTERKSDTVEDDEAEESTTESTTEPISASEKESESYTVGTTRESTSHSATNAQQGSDTADPYNIHQNGYYIIKNTPDGAGLSVREASSSSSTRLEIAKEGTVVKAKNDYSSLDNGYVWVTTSTNTDGWVLASYLYPFNPYADDLYSYTAYIKGVKVRVSYDTPYHAGLNMRSAPSSTSDKITLVEEGVVLDVMKNYSDNDNGYIYVGYDHPHAGEYYYGWVLAEYLEYYGAS